MSSRRQWRIMRINLNQQVQLLQLRNNSLGPRGLHIWVIAPDYMQCHRSRNRALPRQFIAVNDLATLHSFDMIDLHLLNPLCLC